MSVLVVVLVVVLVPCVRRQPVCEAQCVVPRLRIVRGAGACVCGRGLAGLCGAAAPEKQPETEPHGSAIEQTRAALRMGRVSGARARRLCGSGGGESVHERVLERREEGEDAGCVGDAPRWWRRERGGEGAAVGKAVILPQRRGCRHGPISASHERMRRDAATGT